MWGLFHVGSGFSHSHNGYGVSGVGSFDNDPNPDIAQESAQGFEKDLRKDIPLRMTSLSVNP